MKDIEGFEGLYAVTEDGRVWSYPRPRVSGKFLKPQVNRGGYLLVSLSRDAKHKSYTVHRLIAKSLIPNPANLPQLNHRNTNKTDNRVENLEWCTAAGNMLHAKRNNLRPKGQNVWDAKLCDDDVRAIRVLYTKGAPTAFLRGMFGVSRNTICYIVNRTKWGHL